MKTFNFLVPTCLVLTIMALADLSVAEQQNNEAKNNASGESNGSVKLVEEYKTLVFEHNRFNFRLFKTAINLLEGKKFKCSKKLPKKLRNLWKKHLSRSRKDSKRLEKLKKRFTKNNLDYEHYEMQVFKSMEMEEEIDSHHQLMNKYAQKIWEMKTKCKKDKKAYQGIYALGKMSFGIPVQ